jgi:hypothetical protein
MLNGEVKLGRSGALVAVAGNVRCRRHRFMPNTERAPNHHQALPNDNTIHYTVLNDNKLIYYLSSNVYVPLYEALLGTEDSNDCSHFSVGC